MECKVLMNNNSHSNMFGMRIGGGSGHESELDLAMMVSDFLENGGGDSDSGRADLPHLADKISLYTRSLSQYENDLLSVVQSLIHSINETDLHLVKLGPCNASCIRFCLVKLLRLSGYDAAVCSSKWQGSGKVPGGDHEYIDVINHKKTGRSERLIIDLDFRSHFEIARAVDSYDRILNLLPAVYVGSLTKLKQFLPTMVEAARSSLKQNSMPFPPWRSLAYLKSKWNSPYQRQFTSGEASFISSDFSGHKQCYGHLKRLQSSLRSEIEEDQVLKPRNCD